MPLLEEKDTGTMPLEDLVLAAQCGDREAFGQLAIRFEGVVYAVALRRLRNHAEAEELSQEVFLQAWNKIGQLRDAVCFAGWLRSMTHRMAINRAVRRAPLSSVERDVLESSPGDYRSPLREMVDEEQRVQIRAGLSRLKPLDRDTLMAFYFHGHSLVQMSESFSSPIGTIKRRLHVARQRLAKELAESVAGE